MVRTALLLLSCFAFSAPPPQPLRLVVNIPAYRLDAYVDDSLVQSIGIAPGMSRYPTPRGTFTVATIDWYPWWIPPDSPWAAKEKPTPPGPPNPMGRVKLNFKPLYFLHGTPSEQSIGTAASHGCVRLQQDDAVRLALLVHRYGNPELTRSEVDRLVADSATRTVVLSAPVPLEIRYDLVEIRGDDVSVYRDVYGLATRSRVAEVFHALAAHGIDTLGVDAERVRALVRNIPAKGRSMAMRDLMRTTPALAPESPSDSLAPACGER